MLSRIKNKIRNIVSRDKKNRIIEKPQARPKKDLPAEHVDLARRRLLQGIGAIGIAAVAGINTAGCAEESLETKFFRNFDYRDYPPFNPADCKQWPEQTGYVDSHIGLSLQESINQEFGLKVPVNKLLDFYYDQGRITYTALAKTPDEIRNILLSEGIKTGNVTVEDTQYELNINITGTGNPPPEFKLHLLKGLAVFLKYISPDGQMSQINLNFKGNDQGSDVYSGIEKKIQDQNVLFTYKGVTITPDGMEGVFDATSRSYYKSADPSVSAPVIQIDSPETFIAFLRNCQSKHMVMQFFNCHLDGYVFRDLFPEIKFNKPDFRNLTMEQLLEIFKLIPRKPMAFAGFMRFVIGYSKNDRVSSDEFRDPLTTLRSNWGDCDDYTVISYFWAYLQGYTPNLVRISGEGVRHVLIWYQNEENQIVIIDNSRCQIIQAGESIDTYLQEEYPNHKKEFDQHV